MDILILNGPNLKYIGQREPHIYGEKGLDALPSLVAQEVSPRLNLTLKQSNSEGELINYLEEAWEKKVSGIVINAGAYTHTSIAIADCLSWIKIPYVEVHLSNVYAREEFRHKSYLSAKALGVISGFGIYSYVLGVKALYHYLSQVES
ncbi:MAG: 3-dehydroquinate dehydratase [Desulfonauticus sp.]|jgi:3-dehydroquinate dehydratase-2|nr:MAG: 3-dehydroquinate dehydratase [Desulfonauticus sp. 38_4375]MDK2920740.1 3-dehydroquinate dehydratase [Desulfonauticus sp.]